MANKTKITDEGVAKIIELRKKGNTQQEIADELGITRSLAQYYIGKHFHSNGHTVDVRLEERRDFAESLYHAGMHVEDISEHTGLSTVQIYKAMRKRGVYRKRKFGRRRAVVKALEQAKAGYTTEHVAKVHGVCKKTVSDYLKEDGFDKGRILSDLAKKSMALWACGYSANQIAKELGCSSSNASRHAKRHGIWKPRKGMANAQLILDKLCELGINYHWLKYAIYLAYDIEDPEWKVCADYGGDHMTALDSDEWMENVREPVHIPSRFGNFLD